MNFRHHSRRGFNKTFLTFCIRLANADFRLGFIVISCQSGRSTPAEIVFCDIHSPPLSAAARQLAENGSP
jgi:hypothetical protein